MLHKYVHANSSCVHQLVLFHSFLAMYKAPVILEACCDCIYLFITFRGVTVVWLDHSDWAILIFFFACGFNKGFQLTLFCVFRPLCTSW